MPNPYEAAATLQKDGVFGDSGLINLAVRIICPDLRPANDSAVQSSQLVEAVEDLKRYASQQLRKAEILSAQLLALEREPEYVKERLRRQLARAALDLIRTAVCNLAGRASGSTAKAYQLSSTADLHRQAIERSIENDVRDVKSIGQQTESRRQDGKLNGKLGALGSAATREEVTSLRTVIELARCIPDIVSIVNRINRLASIA